MMQSFYSYLRRYGAVCLGVALLSSAGCSTDMQQAKTKTSAPIPEKPVDLTTSSPALPDIDPNKQGDHFTSLPPVPQERNAHVLKAGDRIHINVRGEPNLSGDYTLDQEGKVYIPLIGAVNIAGKDIENAQTLVRDRLADGYLKQPYVQISRKDIKPVYILGEVTKADEYDYAADLTVFNLIAMAGGFRASANETRFKLMRPRENGGYDEYAATRGDLLQPGDIVYIGQEARE